MPAIPPGDRKTCGTPGCFVMDRELEQIGKSTYVCPHCKTEYGVPSWHETYVPLDKPKEPAKVETTEAPTEASNDDATPSTG